MRKFGFFLIAIIAFSCQPKTDFSPREINWDRDICVKCLMGLAEQEYSAQSINQWGDVIWFDDLGCYINFKGGEDWKKFTEDGPVKSWIGDCETGEWIELEKAYYRYGDRTPMGYGYGALKMPNDSTFDYETTVQRIKDGITLRKKFMMKHKIGKKDD